MNPTLDPQLTGNVGPLLPLLQMGDFWVIINKVATTPTAYVLLPSEVHALARRAEKEGRVSFWLQPTDYDNVQFHEKWSRIGHGRDEVHPAAGHRELGL